LLHNVVQHADERNDISVQRGLRVETRLCGVGPLAWQDALPRAGVEQVLAALGGVEDTDLASPQQASCSSD
jgi:hypothetical protein